MPAVRVLLVDDHALFRDGMVSLFRYQEDFVIVGEAGDGREALAQAQRLRPDLVLMDIDLPGEDGVVTTRRLQALLPATIVVMLTVFDDADKLLDAIKAGAQGYLVKNIRSGDLLAQLRSLADGEAAISRRMATRLLEEFQGRGEPALPESDLTPRELEILELVAERLANKAIAARLAISENTVKNHLKNILGKLHLRSRRQAAAYGIARGWIASIER